MAGIRYAQVSACWNPIRLCKFEGEQQYDWNNDKCNWIKKNISVHFNNGDQQIDAVKNVDLTIPRGDIYGIIGYSGAGKSTLVRVINLLQKPTAGTVIVNNQKIQQLKPVELRQARKKVSMIFQHFNLMKSRTVQGNVNIRC